MGGTKNSNDLETASSWGNIVLWPDIESKNINAPEINISTADKIANTTEYRSILFFNLSLYKKRGKVFAKYIIKLGTDELYIPAT